MKLQPIEIKEPRQLPGLQSFLASNKLPFRDIQLNGNLFLTYCDTAGNILGSGGIEIYGNSALLRSVAVHTSARGKQLGQQIVDDIMQRARVLKIQSIYLLTETAHDFFLKKGFNVVSRDEVPGDLKTSSEFSFVCPASAKCMLFTFNA